MYKTVGMLRIPYFAAMVGLLSTSTLPQIARSLYSSDNSSTNGPIIRHGPHHSAQKSSNTGLSDFNTISSKFLSVISTVIIVYFQLIIFNGDKFTINLFN